jgi:hypothetical protein
MFLIILLILGAIAYKFRSDLINFMLKPQSKSKPYKPVKPAGSKLKPILKQKKDSPNALIDFMLKPKSEGPPHKPRIRWRR